ncbi:thioredoxin family protein [Candidatus Micrarchaeota archaeon]|nr:thioredoxin family protein [Candidatus Micrarchaeota archaeon]
MKLKTSTLAIILLLTIVAVLGASFMLTSNAGKPSFADDASPVMYFYSEACHFCQQQKPILESLASEGFRVKLMDMGSNPALGQQFGVTGTPTFVAEDGAKKIGLTQKEELKAWLLLHGAKIA